MDLGQQFAQVGRVAQGVTAGDNIHGASFQAGAPHVPTPELEGEFIRGGSTEGEDMFP